MKKILETIGWAFFVFCLVCGIYGIVHINDWDEWFTLESVMNYPMSGAMFNLIVCFFIATYFVIATGFPWNWFKKEVIKSE